MFRETSIKKMYFLGFLVIILILTVSIGGIWIWEENRHFHSRVAEFEKEYMESKRELMHREVTKIMDLIEFEITQAEKSVRTRLRNRVLEAYTVALETWQKNKGLIDDRAIKRLIIAQLKGIRFDNGLGYYFAAEGESDREVLADRSELAGRELTYLTDKSAEAEVRGMVGMATRKEEGYIQYRIPKPRRPGSDLPKLSFIKYFEPFEWYIGAGVYLDDLQREIQKQVLDRIFGVRIEPGWDIYIFRYQGIVLFHGQKRYISRNMLGWTDPDGKEVFREMLEAGREPDGGFIRFKEEKPETGRPAPKMAYARSFEDWQWIIAMDMFTDDIEAYLEKEKTVQKEQLNDHMAKMLMIFLGFILLSIVVSSYFSKRLDREFRIFADFFQSAASTHKEIDQTSLNIIEFRNLAVSANQMIAERKRVEEDIRGLNEELEERVKQRTMQLEAANDELKAFAYSVSHDLRAPLRAIDGFSRALLDDYFERLDEDGRDYLNRVRAGSRRMGQLIDDILKLSRLSRTEMRYTIINMSDMIRTIVEELEAGDTHRRVKFVIASGIKARGDPRLLRVVLENLLGNAWKFTAKKDKARIEFGREEVEGRAVFFVRDNGAGFDMAYVDKLFGAFQRLHHAAEFPGTGIGLATVQRVIHRHGGMVWAEAAVNEGATFYFNLNAGMKDTVESEA